MRLLAASLALAATGAPSAADDPVVHWNSRSYETTRLPEEIPVAARAAIEAWSAWTKELDYRLDLERTGRVLLISPSENGRVGAQLELVESAIEFFDEHVPRADPQALRPYGPIVPAPEPVAPEVGPLPEDPEGEAPWEAGGFGKKTEKTESAPVETKWGVESVEPDVETIVFLVVRDERDYRKLLGFLGKGYPYLATWVREATRQQGFSLQLPLAGAFLLLADGQEEWNPDNELVNRLTQVLALRRFGTLPNWLVQGIAWTAELAVNGAIYCFPYRSEFVGIGEHGGWERELQRRFADRGKKKDVLDPREFTSWRRGRYRDEAARISWGVVNCLTRLHPTVLSLIAQSLADYRDADNRVSKGDGQWERDLDYDIPEKVQAEIVELYLGKEVWSEITRFFRDREVPEPKRR